MKHKIISLEQLSSDDPDFISNIETIIRYKIDSWKPIELYLTRIDNWFDDKWVNFAGTIMHELSIRQFPDVKVPPFHPHRVERSELYILENNGYKKRELFKPLHKIQSGEDNLRRKITDITNNGLFFWYSSNSKQNNIGALMAYFIFDNECFTFYVSLTGDKDWDVYKTINITFEEVQYILGKFQIK